jgi:hypothetical protein
VEATLPNTSSTIPTSPTPTSNPWEGFETFMSSMRAVSITAKRIKVRVPPT